jgi:hypothetical protein
MMKVFFLKKWYNEVQVHVYWLKVVLHLVFFFQVQVSTSRGPHVSTLSPLIKLDLVYTIIHSFNLRDYIILEIFIRVVQLVDVTRADREMPWHRPGCMRTSRIPLPVLVSFLRTMLGRGGICGNSRYKSYGAATEGVGWVAEARCCQHLHSRPYV